MDKLDLRIQKIATQYLSIPEDFNRRTEQTLKNVKYRKTENNNIFGKIKSQKINKIKILNGVVIAVFLLCVTTVLAYTIENKINVKVNQETSEVDTVDIYDNIEKYMIYNNSGSYFQIISNYEEYLEAKNNYGNIIPLNEEDFENYFVVLIANLRDGVDGLYVSNIESEDDKLTIFLERKASGEYEADERLISVKIEKEFYTENIDIVIHSSNNTEEKYSDISTFPVDYTKEEAITDGYIVIYNGNIISNNLNAIDEFIESADDGAEIRIVDFNDLYKNCYVVSDITFKNGQYELTQIEIGEGAYFDYPRSYTCEFMSKIETSSGYSYVIEDNDGYNNRSYNICLINR